MKISEQLKLEENEDGDVELVMGPETCYEVDGDIHFPITGGKAKWLLQQLIKYVMVTEPPAGSTH